MLAMSMASVVKEGDNNESLRYLRRKYFRCQD